MAQPVEKKKNSFRDMLLIVFVVLVCFGLTIFGIVFLTGKVFTSEEKVEIAKIQPPKAATDPEKGDILTFSSESEVKPAEPLIEDNIAKPIAPIVETKPKPTPAPKVEPAPLAKPVVTPPPALTENKPKDVIIPDKPAPKKEVQKQEPKKEVKKSTSKPNRPTSTQLPNGKYAVQIMASKSLSAAEKEALVYRKSCPDIYIQKSDLGEKGVWYRVRCGVTNSNAEAERIKNMIAVKFNIKPIVVENK